MWGEQRRNARTTEQELAALRRRIEAAERELVDREAELIDLRVESQAFQLEYDRKVGRKHRELQDTEAAIERCKRQIADYRHKAYFGDSFISVEEQYRRTWQEPPPPGPARPPRPIDPATQRDLKSLYRQLCRRFHPDLTQDPDERAWRTGVMSAINAAYEAQSLTELQALAVHPDRPSAAQVEADEHRVEALAERLDYLQRRLGEIKREIHELLHSPLMEISLEVKLAARHGQDLFAELAAQVEVDLERKRAELAFMQAQLRQLGIEE